MRRCRPAVIPLAAGWSDVGAWDTLWDVLPKDDDGNVVQGDVVMHDCHNTLAMSQGRLLTCLGVDDLIVVETPDAILVANKNNTQDVKKIVDHSSRARAAPRASCTARCSVPGGHTTGRSGRTLPGQAHRRQAGWRAILRDALPPRGTLDRRARHGARDVRRRELPGHRERIDVHPAGHAAPPRNRAACRSR